MIFEYDQQKVFVGSLDVVDAGNMCIRCISEHGDEYYIFTKTLFGKVSMLKIGPFVDGLDMLIDGFTAMYKKFDYKENIIQKEVQSYINDPKKSIKELEEIQPEEMYDKIPNIIDLYINVE